VVSHDAFIVARELAEPLDQALGREDGSLEIVGIARKLSDCPFPRSSASVFAKQKAIAFARE